jgi:predicted RNase H-like HicB family nuclease
MVRTVVLYTRDDEGWWLAEIPSVPGCRTQAPTLALARKRIRRALSACFEDPRAAACVVLQEDR